MRIINIIDEADQEHSILVDTKRMTIRFWFNSEIERWHFDVSSDGDPILYGRKLVVGIDLLEGLSIDVGLLFAIGDAVPDYDALVNGNVIVYHAEQSEVDAL